METASRLFREQGTHVSVADLMKAAGLTHGGFYKQFASKEALVDEATAHAFDELARHHDRDGARASTDRAARRRPAGADRRLPLRRAPRQPGGRAAPSPHSPPTWRANGEGREARRVYTEACATSPTWLATEDEDGITRLCTMLGALVLARATKDSPLSEEILTAARAALTAAG